MSNWNYLNSRRVRSGQFASKDEDGFNGVFTINVPHDLRPIFVIGSEDQNWIHLGVSIYSDGPVKLPPWGIVKAVKEMFFEPEQTAVQFHFAPDYHVQPTPGRAHLFYCKLKDFPMPPDRIIGTTKNEETQDNKTSAEPEPNPGPGKVINGTSFGAKPETDGDGAGTSTGPEQFPA